MRKNQLKISEVGGKAYNLLRIKKVRHAKFFVLPASFFDNLPNNNIKSLIDIENEIKNRVNKHKKYAVRSSATDEDSANHSFAGIMESYLNVDIAELPQKVLDCHYSAFSHRAAAYREINCITAPPRMAVIIQEMVDADYAGVINTVNPITNNPDEILISVVPGLGDALVSGEKNSVDYIFNCGKISCFGRSILSDRIIKKLADMAYTVERQCSTFQDIEFAIRKGKIYFLQTRDIVTYKNIDLSQQKVILDNSNIIESFSGTVTPLTFSFAKEMYSNVFTEAFRQGHISKKAQNSTKLFTQNLLAYHDCRIYYNLSNWYAMTGVFPNAKSRAGQLDRMIGVNTQTKQKKIKIGLFNTLKFIFTFLHRLRRLQKDVEIFTYNFYKEFLNYSVNGFGTLTEKQLVEVYSLLTKKTNGWFVTPTLNDTGAMAAYAKLVKYVSKFDFPNKDGYISSLLINLGGVESALSSKMFFEIVDLIFDNTNIEKDFKNLDCSELYKKYKTSVLTEKIDAYLSKFGARVADELKLETVTMIQCPEQLFAMLKLYIAGNLTKPERQRELPKAPQGLTIHQNRKIAKLANKAGFYIRNREKMRLTRTHLFSATRNMFLRLGELFFERDVIQTPRDIFFLAKNEAFEIALSGETKNVKGLIAARKEELKKCTDKNPPDRIVFYGNERLNILKSKKTNGLLCGVPSGAGVVTGKVKYVANAASVVLNGEIILTKRTDPGWVTLFPLCSGLIAENGSVLSHSAVVAREMGIPAVVGVPNATKLIKDGSIVTLDAIKGEVTVHE